MRAWRAGAASVLVWVFSFLCIGFLTLLVGQWTPAASVAVALLYVIPVGLVTTAKGLRAGLIVAGLSTIALVLTPGGSMWQQSSVPLFVASSLLCVTYFVFAGLVSELVGLNSKVDAARRTWECVFDSLREGIVVIDRDGRVLQANQAMADVLGMSLDDVAGKDCSVVCGRDGSIGCAHLVVGRSEAGSERTITRGSKEMLLTSSTLVLESGPAIVHTLREISDEIAASRRKTEFVNLVAHEIRSPVGNIRAATEIIQQANVLGGQVEGVVPILVSETARLSAFVENVLQSNALESGRAAFRRDPVDIAEVAREALRRYFVRFASNRIRLMCPSSSVWVLGDESKVIAVLDNLVENAVKYSPSGSPVRIVVLEALDAVSVTVSDQGSGIPVSERVAVFQPYSRLDGSDSRRTYGYGLGLYIARQLVEGMGGRIWIEASSPKGTDMTFALPRLEGGMEDGQRWPRGGDETTSASRR